MDLAEVSKFETKVGVIKLSEAIRECGYGNVSSYATCVIGRAYKRRTGRQLHEDGVRHKKIAHWNHYIECASIEFGAPVEILTKAEYMCYRGKTPDEIADFVQAQGL